jgi:hypothetical protein
MLSSPELGTTSNLSDGIYDGSGFVSSYVVKHGKITELRTIGRPSREGLVLSPHVEEMRRQSLAKVEALKAGLAAELGSMTVQASENYEY